MQNPAQAQSARPLGRDELYRRIAADPDFALHLSEHLLDYLRLIHDLVPCEHARGRGYEPTELQPEQLARKFVEHARQVAGETGAADAG
jgi:hypothetical protein